MTDWDSDNQWDGSQYEPCTSCGHRSYVRAIMKNGSSVFLCAHHFVKGEDKLNDEGAFIWDMRSLLAAR